MENVIFSIYVIHNDRMERPIIFKFLDFSRKKTSTWWSTVAGCLSVGSPMFFRSGAQEFGEPGWWKLVHNKPPTMKPEGEKLSASTLKVKGTLVRVVQDVLARLKSSKCELMRHPACTRQAHLPLWSYSIWPFHYGVFCVCYK